MQPHWYRYCGEQCEKPEHPTAYGRKRELDGRCQQQHDVDRIGKCLLISGIVWPRWIEHASVVTNLNLPSDVVAIRIPAMQKQLAGTQPSRIKVRQIAARGTCGIRFRVLMR